MTLGERALVDFCETNRVPIKRILEGDKKEPDYEMSVGKQQIFVEVKDLDLNPEEKQASRALKE
jgi:hypothetical protein